MRGLVGVPKHMSQKFVDTLVCLFLGRKKGGLVVECVDYLEKSCVMDTLKFTAMPFGLTNAPGGNFHGGYAPDATREDDRGVTEGREDVCEVFQQRRSRAKRKLSKCGRNQMGNEPILALPEGADDFVVYYDARSKDLEAGLEKGEEALSERDSRWMKLFSEYGFEAKYHLGKANVDVVPWSRKKE
ncbi:hypothetical protein Tco_0519200 [Tanacetum coccineum]